MSEIVLLVFAILGTTLFVAVLLDENLKPKEHSKQYDNRYYFSWP